MLRLSRSQYETLYIWLDVRFLISLLILIGPVYQALLPVWQAVSSIFGDYGIFYLALKTRATERASPSAVLAIGILVSAAGVCAGDHSIRTESANFYCQHAAETNMDCYLWAITVLSARAKKTFPVCRLRLLNH